MIDAATDSTSADRFRAQSVECPTMRLASPARTGSSPPGNELPGCFLTGR